MCAYGFFQIRSLLRRQTKCFSPRYEVTFNLNSLIFTFSRDLLFLSFLSLREVSTTDR